MASPAIAGTQRDPIGAGTRGGISVMQHVEQVGRCLGKLPAGLRFQRKRAGAVHVAEPDQLHARVCRHHVHPQRGAGGVMACQQTGADRCIGAGRRRCVGEVQPGPVKAVYDLVSGDATGAQNACSLAGAVDHGGFNTAVAAPAIQNQPDPATEAGDDMFGAAGADLARRVGAWSGHRSAKGGEQPVRRRMSRDPQCDMVKPGACQPGKGTISDTRQNQRHRPWPEGGGEGGCKRRFNSQRKGVRRAGDKADQRVEAWPSLGRKNRRHRLGIAGIAAKAVDGFGRKTDKTTLAQDPGRAFDRAVRCGDAWCLMMIRRRRHKVARRFANGVGVAHRTALHQGNLPISGL